MVDPLFLFPDKYTLPEALPASSFGCRVTIRNNVAHSTSDTALIGFGAGKGTFKDVGDGALFDSTFILGAGKDVLIFRATRWKWETFSSAIVLGAREGVIRLPATPSAGEGFMPVSTSLSVFCSGVSAITHPFALNIVACQACIPACHVIDRKKPMLRTDCGLIRGWPILHVNHGVFARSPFPSDGIADSQTRPVQVSVTKNMQHIRAHIVNLLAASSLILCCAFAQVIAECIDALDCHRILENAVLRLQHYLLSVHGSFERQHGSYGDKPENCCVLPY